MEIAARKRLGPSRITAPVAILLLLLPTVGCSRSLAEGAAAGAALGAGAGWAVHGGEGAVVGGVAGMVLGALFGFTIDQEKKKQIALMYANQAKLADLRRENSQYQEFLVENRRRLARFEEEIAELKRQITLRSNQADNARSELKRRHRILEDAIERNLSTASEYEVIILPQLHQIEDHAKRDEFVRRYNMLLENRSILQRALVQI